MITMDIFNNDAFSVTTLLGQINSIPFRPGKIGQLGLFTEQGLTTTTAGFERIGTTLMLVPVSPRGGVPPTQPRDRRSMISISAPRLALQDAVYADEVQNLRAIGSMTALETVQGLLRQRLAKAAGHLDQTLEWHRRGALFGQVLDADGVSVILDLYSLHGVTKQTEVDFDLDNATPANGALRKKFSQIIRQIEEELGGVPYTGVQGFAGKNFMEDLVAHPQFTNTFQGTDAARLRDRTVGIEVSFAGITISEYPGKVNGIQFVDDDKAVFFPTGVADLFQTWYAPADYEETVNTLGLPRYAKTAPDPTGFDRMRQVEAQTNPINFCSRPRVVQFARRT
jgi:hypothetical protein